jgi:hypothetical protein
MKKTALAAIALFSGVLSPSAWAGTVPAGPAGGGATVVGSVVIPPFESEKEGKTHTQIIPVGDARALAQRLWQIPGAQTNAAGTFVQAPITLADGSAATMSVDTETGVVTVIKQ